MNCGGNVERGARGTDGPRLWEGGQWGEGPWVSALNPGELDL